MRSVSAAFARYRPRLLTLMLLLVIGAPLVLANLSPDYRRLSFGEVNSQRSGRHGQFGDEFYGWPLTWHRYVIAMSSPAIVGSYFSAGRLAANAALWLVMLAAPAGVCEWLVRRYRLRLRWSLRAMLAAVGLLAAGCAWFVAARERAKNNEQIFAAVSGREGELWVERWGPRWLDLVGADRFRQQIVGIEFPPRLQSREMALRAGNVDDEGLLKRLASLPRLQYLFLTADRLSPDIADALGALPGLRALSIEQKGIAYMNQAASRQCLEAIGNMIHLESLDLLNVTGDSVSPECLTHLTNLKSLRVSHGDWFSKSLDQRKSDEWLAVIGQLTQLESLELSGIALSIENLASLAGLKKLESLVLRGAANTDWSLYKPSRRRLGVLPALPRLRRLELHSFQVLTRDLRFFAALPQVESLYLEDMWFTSAGLADLRELQSLKELAIGGDLVSAAVIEPLVGLKHLTAVHLQRDSFAASNSRRPAVTLDDQRKVLLTRKGLGRFLSALAALRRAKPGITIDTKTYASSIHPHQDWSGREALRSDYEASLEHRPDWLPASGAPWMTAAERTQFVSEGGWARFDAAGWRPGDGPITEF